MTILTKRKKRKIAKILAAIWYDITFGIEDPSDDDIHTIADIISCLAEAAVEIGGLRMAKDVADLYDVISREVEGMEESV